MFNGQMTLAKTKFLSRIALSGFCFFAGLLGASQTTFATDSTITITLSENAVTANVAPFTTSSGTFVQSSGMTVGVSTNHISGYTLNISASDTTTPGRLKNGSSYLQSIATPTTLNNFKNADLSNSDLATSLGLSDCTEITESSNCKGIWGYKPNYLYNATMDTTDTNDLFLPTPGTAGQTIAKTSGPNATANEYTITLGTKVSPLATIGSYTNAFIFAAVGNNIPYIMEFSENTVQNMPINILDGSTSGTTATIPSGTVNTPTRPGYRFAGWCDQATTKSGNSDTCATGHSHQPGDTISLNQTGANNIKLYAMWEEIMTFDKAFTDAGKTKNNGYYEMQGMNSGICASVADGEQTQLIDNRDGNVYQISKQADGKCWMTQNLDLELSTNGARNPLTGGYTTLTSDNTHLTTSGSNSYSDGYTDSNGVITWIPASSATTSAHILNTTVSSDNRIPTQPTIVPEFNNSSYDKPETVEGGDLIIYIYNLNGNYLAFSSLSDCVSHSELSESECRHFQVGNYYNWSAAVASNSFSNNDGSDYENVANDICPKGWRLPKGTAASRTPETVEYGGLLVASGAMSGVTQTGYKSGGYEKVRQSPLFFTSSGDISSSSSFLLRAYFWTSTTKAAYQYYATLDNSLPSMYKGDNGTGRHIAIRCVAETE